jgi:hypothetical protein
VGAIEDRLDGLGSGFSSRPACGCPVEFERVPDGLTYVSWHGPGDGDRLLVSARLGAEVSIAQPYGGARATALFDAGVAEA